MNNFEAKVAALNASEDAQYLLETIINPAEIPLLEKTKEKAESIIQNIGPDIEVSLDAQSGKIFMVFTNKKLNIVFAIDLDVENGKFMNDDYLSNNFQNEIIQGYVSQLSRRINDLTVHTRDKDVMRN